MKEAQAYPGIYAVCTPFSLAATSIRRRRNIDDRSRHRREHRALRGRLFRSDSAAPVSGPEHARSDLGDSPGVTATTGDSAGLSGLAGSGAELRATRSVHAVFDEHGDLAGPRRTGGDPRHNGEQQPLSNDGNPALHWARV